MGYKVKPSKILAKAELDAHSIPSQRCFLGVSVDSPFINSKHIEQVLQWIAGKFKSCVILIGDDLHRHTEMIFGSDEKNALKKCARFGVDAEVKLKSALEKIGDSKFTIHHWSTYSSEQKFTNYWNQYISILQENEDFRAAIAQCAKNYLQKQKEKGRYASVTESEAIRLSTAYILEEMAVFSVLMYKGYSTLVYPGTSLQIFKELSAACFLVLKPF